MYISYVQPSFDTLTDIISDVRNAGCVCSQMDTTCLCFCMCGHTHDTGIYLSSKFRGFKAMELKVAIGFHKLWYTYIRAIHHCLAANAAADLKSEKPSKETVGQMHRGPMNRNMTPIAPVAPSNTSNTAAHMMAPWICKAHHRHLIRPGLNWIEQGLTSHQTHYRS